MPCLRARLLASCAAAISAAAICYVRIREIGYATDFAWFWLAGRCILEGLNPYDVIHAGTIRGITFDNGFVYPLPAAVASVPFALFSPLVASILFVATMTFCLCFALTREDWNRWPILMSFPMLWAMSAGQWSPLVTAAALSPLFGFAAAIKPTLGAAAWVRRPTVPFIIAATVFAIPAFLINPTWPFDWWHATNAATKGFYHVPVLVPGGFILVLAAIRWRSPDARLLLGMSIVPQTMLPYDQLALGLIARTRIQAYIYGLWSYVPLAVVPVVERFVSAPTKAQSLEVLSYVIVGVYYLPALAVVLLRRRELATIDDDARSG